MWHIDSEHWTKGMSKFLWNTGVLTHDFFGGLQFKYWVQKLEVFANCVLKAEGKCWEPAYPNDCLVPCTQVQGTGAGALVHLERREGAAVAAMVGMSRSRAEWCEMGRHWENVQLVLFYKWFYIEQTPEQVVRVRPLLFPSILQH